MFIPKAGIAFGIKEGLIGLIGLAWCSYFYGHSEKEMLPWIGWGIIGFIASYFLNRWIFKKWIW